jgi:hypothetical protein
MKIVFLHLDNVVTSFESYAIALAKLGEMAPFEELRDAAVDPVLVGRLNKLTDVGCQIVIASSWRYASDLATIERALAAKGFTGKLLSVLGDEPTDDKAMIAWLKEFAPSDAKFAVVETGKIGCFESNTVVASQGLSDDNVTQILEILK